MKRLKPFNPDSPFPRIDFEQPIRYRLPIAHFLDSGSFSLLSVSKKWAEENNKSPKLYYDTDEFWVFFDSYIEFVTHYQDMLCHYSVMDAIGYPELTFRNQLYMEEKRLKPIPCVHFGSDVKWLTKYVQAGYGYISLGGLAGHKGRDTVYPWLNKCFDLICDTPNRLPKVKTHGFATTSFSLMRKYPWYSVDSSSWSQSGAFGNIYVPPKRNAQWDFHAEPLTIPMSMESSDYKNDKTHYYTLSKNEQAHIREWLNFINIDLGEMASDGSIKSYGAITRHLDRRAANLRYFEFMKKTIPKYPWPWKPPVNVKGFDIKL